MTDDYRTSKAKQRRAVRENFCSIWTWHGKIGLPSGNRDQFWEITACNAVIKQTLGDRQLSARMPARQRPLRLRFEAGGILTGIELDGVIEVSHRSYLDMFLVNGRPIDDWTAEEAEASAHFSKPPGSRAGIPNRPLTTEAV